MAKRKAKGRPAAKPQPKAAVKTGPGSSRWAAIGVIAAALVILIVYAGMSMNDNSTTGDTNASTANQTAPQAPPMTGIEAKTIGAIDTSKAKVATFKLVELSGSDCLESVAAQFRILGGVGEIKGDYDNALCEVQYDPGKVDEAKIIEALSKSNHPGQVTSERVKADAAPQPSAEDTQK